MPALFALSAGGGVLLGWAFSRLWSLALPPRFLATLVSGVGEAARAMLAAEDVAHYLEAYGRALRLAADNMVRALVAFAVALLPLILYAVILGPTLGAWRDAGSTDLSITVSGGSFPGPQVRRLTIAEAAATPPLVTGSLRLDPAELRGRHAYCSGTVTCAGLAALGLTPHPLDGDSPGLLAIVRPYHAAYNPFWPYLDDPDVLFMAAMTVTMVAMMRRRRTRAAAQA